MNKLLLIIFITAITQIPVQTFAQKQGQALIDSLKTELAKAKQDTTKVNLLLDITYEYEKTDFNKAMEYGYLALELSEKLKWKRGITRSQVRLAYHYREKVNYEKSLEYYLKALKISEELKNFNDSLRTSTILQGMAGIYFNQYNFGKSLDYGMRSIKALPKSKPEDYGFKNHLARSYNTVGISYLNLQKLDSANFYLLECERVYTELEDIQGLLYLYPNLSLLYQNMEDYLAALDYSFKGLEKRSELKIDGRGLSTTYYSIATAYASCSLQGIPTDSDPLLVKKYIANRTKQELSYLAIEYAEKAVAASKRDGELSQETHIYGLLSSFREILLEDYKGALEDLKTHVLLKDSLISTERDKKLVQKTMEFEQEKKDVIAAQKLQRQKIYTFSGAGAVLLLLGFLIFVFRSKKRLSAEKQKSENLLLNILPEEVAEELKQKGSAEAKQFDEVSILFTDFVSFTQTSEQLSPQQLVQELNECFTAFDNIIERNGLEKIKTIGDAYLAVCGLPVSDPLHARKTVAAAIEIRDFVEKRKQGANVIARVTKQSDHEGLLRAARNDAHFDIRIGIHSGSVVAGIVGVKKFAYDIWGDTVNTAARMEQSGEPGKVNISETTYELVKENFACEYRGEIEAKGKGMMKMYFVE